MESGKDFNMSSDKCDFYILSSDENINPSIQSFCNIRYIFDVDTINTLLKNPSEYFYKFVHLVEIPDDALVELGIYYHKSNKLNIKKTWKIENFLNINKLQIFRMISNRHMFNNFDDVNYTLPYSV